ncbi:hypothetical protein [Adhaeribacter radiodurans]|uniref:Uncharacterized protein n=1 Tax=Adhaeribacter radiodurans TaxID=2745197 RepID=A0A7L7LE87_9BACT|nr:hypothetical protein [Adhaeribacter radiodurans]QMU30994.1 hypothetical protein HUW48_24530 [Adhaeribacter radiodurans]
MKPAKSLLLAFQWKKWSTTLIIVVALLLPVFSSSGQTNGYEKGQVKEKSIKGMVLVADNMTNWLSKANRTTGISKKINTQTYSKPVSYSCLIVYKVKNQSVSKAIKRS